MKTLKYILFFLIIHQTFSAQEQTENKEVQNQIKGLVLDYDSSPLSDSEIRIKGTNLFKKTSEEGRFVINGVEHYPLTIVVNKKGYQTLNVELKEYQPEITIKLNIIEKYVEAVVVTSRRRAEEVQKIPIPIAVLGAKKIEETGAFNVNRLKELVPSVQLYSSNPRNTTLNIRGLGSTFGLTNDGIDPGVGFYIDGVYYARPAATSLDFIDIERVEVLRGPQGTLFGKNTTAGAFNIVTKKPIFNSLITTETSFGNYGYIQAKISLNNKLSNRLAGRLSFSGTQRDGVIENVRTDKWINDINNLGVKGQLLYKVNDHLEILFSGDFTRQRPDGYAQVFAGVVPTKRAAYRQFNNIIADLGYSVPYPNPFDRKVDTDTPWKSNNDLGGLSLSVDGKVGSGKITSTTAWRFWDWNPSSDRDFIGLSVLSKSQAPSYHTQWSQEFRYVGDLIKDRLSIVAGLFAISQNLSTNPYQTEEAGNAQWRFAQNSTSNLWKTPGLLDGYGIKTIYSLKNNSFAFFTQLDWALTEKLHLLPGIRYNYDEKIANYNRTTYGGLQTADPALLALKKLVYTDQNFAVSKSDRNWSGQLTLNYNLSDKIISFITYAKSYKPAGVNIGGLPTENGRVMTELATIKPEAVNHYELGFKSNFKNALINLTLYNTDITDYQTNVQSPELGVNRGYLANAEKVNVKGIELETGWKVSENINLNSSVSYTDGRYVKFTNAPLPLEETGSSVAYKDISGGRLPGISKWSGSLGADYTTKARLLSYEGAFFIGANVYYRSEFSSSPSPSDYLNIKGYSIFNLRLGYKTENGTTFTLWGRNLFNQNYFEQLLPAAGNAGQYAGVLGDPVTYGITVKFILK